jgi:hypothetical protein
MTACDCCQAGVALHSRAPFMYARVAVKRSRRQGWLAVAVYVAAVVLCPAAHLSHHAAAATIEHTHGAGEAELPAAAPDLVALGLEDVGAPAVVDCALAAITLVDCETPAHGTRRFGDVAPSAPPSFPPLDPRHGAGKLEHLGVSILAARTFVLPPPRRPEARLPICARPSPFSFAARLTHESRGPPARV